jgi:putative DNA primase/helicase
MAEGQDDEEWRKRITALLLRAPVVILVDNVCRRIDSAALAAVLTTTVWTDRILGKTATVTVPIRAIWLATGNNVTVSNEIARRSLWMRLDARTDMPWQRSGFRHPDLRGWALKNRGRLVHAGLTLVQAWLAAGRPSGEANLGSFESWASTIGGILKVAGVPGFLANADQLYIQADAENQEWRAFVARWWDTHADGRVGTDQLYDIADDLAYQEGLLVEVLGDGGERSKRTRLGKALGRLRDRIFSGFRIIDEGEDRRGRRRYRLERVADATTSRRRSPGRVMSTSAPKTDGLTDF